MKRISIIISFAILLVGIFAIFFTKTETVKKQKEIPKQTLADTATDLTDTTESGDTNSKCATRATEFVQITDMHLNEGEQTFEAFRISRDGNIEWARWNSLNEFLDYGKTLGMGNEMFERVLLSETFLDPPKPSQNDGALGRLAYTLEIATLSESGTHTLSMTKMPDDIAVLVNELRRSVVATPMKRGWYLWTKPYQSIDKPDIDLTSARCNSGIEEVLSEAIATGSLVARADDSIQTFISGEHAYRTTFSARIIEGGLYFGILYRE